MPAQHTRNSGGDKTGELHLTALDTVVLEAAKQRQRRLERRIPLISLADLLNEVDRWTGFLRHFTDLVSDEVPEGKRRQMLTALAVLGGWVAAGIYPFHGSGAAPTLTSEPNRWGLIDSAE
jgi:hypothetical protein